MPNEEFDDILAGKEPKAKTNEKTAAELVKSGLVERNKADLVKSGGKTLMDKYVALFKTVQEQTFSTKKLIEGEIIIGTILEGQIRNSVAYPDNYQIMLKCVNVYRYNPYPEVEIADEEYHIEEKREIIFLAKAGATSVLRQLKIPEPEKGYNLKELSEKANLFKGLKDRRYTLKYMGLKEFEGKSFNSYIIKLI